MSGARLLLACVLLLIAVVVSMYAIAVLDAVLDAAL